MNPTHTMNRLRTFVYNDDEFLGYVAETLKHPQSNTMEFWPKGIPTTAEIVHNVVWAWYHSVVSADPSKLAPLVDYRSLGIGEDDNVTTLAVRLSVIQAVLDMKPSRPPSAGRTRSVFKSVWFAYRGSRPSVRILNVLPHMVESNCWYGKQQHEMWVGLAYSDLTADAELTKDECKHEIEEILATVREAGFPAYDMATNSLKAILAATL